MYGIKDIINNNNLIFDIKKDIIFKNVFLNENNIDYLKLIISSICDIDNDSKFIIKNNELKSNKSIIKSSFSDLIVRNGNTDYIIEMNMNYSKNLYYKNYYYLLKQHINKIYKKNNYGINKYTVLINIDNYDVLKKGEFIYSGIFTEETYNNIMYQNIKSININLDYIKNKFYNNIELSDKEKIFILFITQEKDKIYKTTDNKIIKEVIRYMEELEYEENYVATYDREEFEDAVTEELLTNKILQFKRSLELENIETVINNSQKELENRQKEFENNKKELENNKKELENNKKELENNKKELENNKKSFENEKVNFARELKKQGIPINKILNITKLSIDKINML